MNVKQHVSLGKRQIDTGLFVMMAISEYPKIICYLRICLHKYEVRHILTFWKVAWCILEVSSKKIMTLNNCPHGRPAQSKGPSKGQYFSVFFDVLLIIT